MDKSIGGPDASFSLDENEFKTMVEAIQETEKLIGDINYTLTEKQKLVVLFVDLYMLLAILKKESTFTKKNIKSIRPGFGLHPKHYYEILGQKAKIDFKKGDRLIN